MKELKELNELIEPIANKIGKVVEDATSSTTSCALTGTTIVGSAILIVIGLLILKALLWVLF